MLDVLTNRYSASRVGASLGEQALNTANVNVRQFGKLFTRNVDGDIYAQPLIVSGVNIDRAPRTVVYVATSNNSPYAFDAEDPRRSDPFWRLSQADLGTPVPRGDVGSRPYRDFATTIGITSTPVVDKTSNMIYFETKSKRNSSYVHHLHARDLSTGEARPGGPMRITAHVPGDAPDAKDGCITFDPRGSLNRPALLLMNNILYLGFGSHGDHLSMAPGRTTVGCWPIARILSNRLGSSAPPQTATRAASGNLAPVCAATGSTSTV